MIKIMYSIFVNTTDSFEDCWYPFFVLFKNFWPNCDEKIYLNTETKDFSFLGLNIISIKNNIQTPNKKIKWSDCLIRGLNEVETDIILYLQEDYFINNYVDFNQIDEFVNLMGKEDITCIHLTSVGPHGPYISTQNKKLNRVAQKAHYRISTQASLWKKETLIKYLRPNENPWQFERNGTKRSYEERDNFSIINFDFFNNEKKIIPYNATGIIRGKWVKEIVFELFRENNIKIHFNKRGFYNPKIEFINRVLNRIKTYF